MPFFRLAALALLALPVTLPARAADDPQWHYGLSLLGDLKYPQDFKHFDYVNPDAPKGGLVRIGVLGSFDNFDIVNGKGEPVGGTAYLYQTLMEPALDEPSSEYGEIADKVRYPDDHSSVTYHINPAARWNDGQPITADDVAWSFDTQKKLNPQIGVYYHDVVKAAVTGDREVTFTFDKAGNRELPQIVGQLSILPKHWWMANGPDGKPRDISHPGLEPPLGSGPYRLKSFEAGRTALFERVPDWWAKDLPVNVGRYNFDTIRYAYFRDNDVMREAFKADAYDFRLELSAKDWSTSYDVPAVQQGRILRQEFADKGEGRMQAFVLNLREPKFQDWRVRRAFNDAFDFETLNKALFFGLYTRIDSYFSGLDLASSGLPQGDELAILNSVRGKIQASVFTTPYANPVNGSDEAVRSNLRDAIRLLKAAGWEVKGGKLVNAQTGEPMIVEFLLDSPTMERVALAYKPALERLGITVSIRTVDSAQYEQRVRSRQFDIIASVFAQSQSPGNEQRDFWGSAAADRDGSHNVMGLKDPGVDALVDRVVYAKDRDELVATTHALDRVLLAGNYLVPQWRSATWRTLRWDRFSGPATVPDQSLTGGFPDEWWFDQAKAAKTGAAK